MTISPCDAFYEATTAGDLASAIARVVDEGANHLALPMAVRHPTLDATVLLVPYPPTRVPSMEHVLRELRARAEFLGMIVRLDAAARAPCEVQVIALLERARRPKTIEPIGASAFCPILTLQ